MATPEAEITVACAQFEPKVGERATNIAAAVAALEAAADQGADLVVLPELADSGYVFETREEAFELASDPATSDSIAAWSEVAHRRGLHVVAGFAERAGQHRLRWQANCRNGSPACSADKRQLAAVLLGYGLSQRQTNPEAAGASHRGTV